VGLIKLWRRVSIVFLFAVSSVSASQELTPLQTQGKQLYRQASSPFGNTITAYVGQSSVPLPATAMPCVGCHGRDGKGRPEGGLVPSNIIWSNLTKSYGGESTSGRRYPPYTEQSFYQAVVKGIDPAGNRLDPGMPRFDLSNDEVRALIAYLKKVDLELDPGITDDHIVIGSLQPAIPALQSLGQAATAVMQSYFADVNQTGGIFGRQLQLRVENVSSTDDTLAKAERLLDSETVFSMLNVFTGSQDKTFAQLAEKYNTPSVGPFTRHPASGDQAQHYTFYLFGGAAVQTKALQEFASKQLHVQPVNMAIVYPEDNNSKLVNELGNMQRDGEKGVTLLK